MQKTVYLLSALVALCVLSIPAITFGQGNGVSEGQRLFERETFGGNGRTCSTCHSKTTGTLSPQDVQQLFKTHPNDPLFLADGTDDGNGHGTTRIQANATIMMNIPMAPNVSLAADPKATHMKVFRGIPTTLNSPATDPVIMLDGRQPNLQSQALGAIVDHAHATIMPTAQDLENIRAFELTNQFFSSPDVRKFAQTGVDPGLPQGVTDSEKRGRRFFEDVIDFVDFKHGLCAGCHSGPMLNQTNLFAQILFGVPKGTRFQNILVSFFNVAHNPVQEYVFNKGLATETHWLSPDIGRSAITGVLPQDDITFSNFEAFKIPQLRGISQTGPYFHDNSAKTLEDVMEHYDKFFGIGFLNAQDKKDIVAFMKLLQ
jgi:cytochrome c peroxidase